MPYLNAGNPVLQSKLSECDGQRATHGAAYVGDLPRHLLHVHGGFVRSCQRVDGLGGGRLLSTKTFFNVLRNQWSACS